MTDLKLYDAATHALEEAVRVDEVMSIRKQASAFAAYARMAKDPELINKATALRLRAERRAGELLIAMKKSGERAAPEDGRRPQKPRSEERLPDEPEPPKTLKEIGISEDQSSRWQRVAQLPAKEFEERVAQTQRLATQSVTTTPFERAQEKKTKRAAREVELGARQKALPDARFGLIYADPEWKFEVYSEETGMDRSPANHYPVSSLEEIAARDIPSISAEDCVLWLWSTVPMLGHAIRLMEDNWGFTYKSNYTWVKDKSATGYWSKNKHEHLLIGTRGKIPCPAPGTQWESVIQAAVTAHSAKPEIFLEMLEEYYPTIPKIELNRRGPARDGWSAWGNESE